MYVYTETSTKPALPETESTRFTASEQNLVDRLTLSKTSTPRNKNQKVHDLTTRIVRIILQEVNVMRIKSSALRKFIQRMECNEDKAAFKTGKH